MNINVNEPQPEEQNEIGIEVRNVNVPGVFFLIFFGLGFLALSIFGLIKKFYNIFDIFAFACFGIGFIALGIYILRAAKNTKDARGEDYEEEI